jgi:predicted DNA-binding protein (MmcQ/YjbR family)
MTGAEQRTLQKLRNICLALPGAEETTNHGHPTFKVKGKVYAVFHGPEGEPAIAVKVGKEAQALFLKDARYFRTPYIGQHGYVSLHAAGNLDWEEIAEMIQGSYDLTIGPRKK